MGGVTIGSLCSGYGGLEMGLLLAAYRMGVRARVAWQIDNSAEACAILRARKLANVVIEADIAEVDYAALETVDIVCAGLPCQPWTNAGAQRGEADERNLFPAFFDICDRAQPRGIFLENADELPTVDDGRTFRRIVGEIAARYEHIEWGCIAAASVGANHIRERLFLFAYSDSERRQGARDTAGAGTRDSKRDTALQERGRQTVISATGTSGEVYAHTHRLDVEGWQPQAAHHAGQRAVRRARLSQSRVRGTDDGFAARLDAHEFPRGLYDESQDRAPRAVESKLCNWAARMHALGNGVVPQQAAIPAAALLEGMLTVDETKANRRTG